MPTIEVWPGWVTATTSSATTTGGDVWYTRVGTVDCTTTSATVTYTGAWDQWATGTFEVRERIQAEREASAARQAEYQRKQDEWAEQRRKARETAKALLTMLLDAQQKEQLEKKRYFDVISKKGRKYRIREGIAGNVRLVKADGKEALQLCIHPNGVPEEDAMLAQKLMLETDEDAFLKTANLTRLMTDDEAEEIMREAAALKRVPVAA